MTVSAELVINSGIIDLIMSSCIFCKIARGDIPKKFTYEDEEVMVFPDINPVKPIHLLVVSKKHIPDFLDLEDNRLLAKIRKVAQKMIREQNLTDKGYRISVNGGGAQIINHLHFHLIGPLGKAVKM